MMGSRGKVAVPVFSGTVKFGDYSDTPKFVPRKLHQAENFVDHLIL